LWVEAANAEPCQRCFHPIDDACALANQLLALTGRAFCVFLFQGGDSGHAAVLCLAAQPTKQGTLQKPNI
jgi:hypothetical protein